MTSRSVTLLGALAAAAALALPSAAMAQQPLAILVNPLSVVPSVFPAFPMLVPMPSSDPNIFRTNDTAGRPTNTAAAEAAAVSHTPDGLAVIPAPVLRSVGPRYVNPATRSVVVLRRGSTVPSYVPTAYSRNQTVAGLRPQGSYDYFIAPNNRIVFLDPATRRVARIMR